MIDFKFGGPIEPNLFYNREREIDFLLGKLSQVKEGRYRIIDDMLKNYVKKKIHITY